MTPIQFKGVYQVDLNQPEIRTAKLSTQELVNEIEAIGNEFKTRISIAHTWSSRDKTDYFIRGNGTSHTVQPNPTQSENTITVDIKTPAPTRSATLPELADLDLYGTQPPKNADSAFERFLNGIGIRFTKIR